LILNYRKDKLSRFKLNTISSFIKGWIIGPWFGGQETARTSYILNVQKIN
jgi:hypothetical protein